MKKLRKSTITGGSNKCKNDGENGDKTGNLNANAMAID
jgi:hypothetical protein